MRTSRRTTVRNLLNIRTSHLPSQHGYINNRLKLFTRSNLCFCRRFRLRSLAQRPPASQHPPSHAARCAYALQYTDHVFCTCPNNAHICPFDALFLQRFRCMLSPRRKETDLTRQSRTVSDVCTPTRIASLSMCNPNSRFSCFRLFLQASSA